MARTLLLAVAIAWCLPALAQAQGGDDLAPPAPTPVVVDELDGEPVPQTPIVQAHDDERPPMRAQFEVVANPPMPVTQDDGEHSDAERHFSRGLITTLVGTGALFAGGFAAALVDLAMGCFGFSDD